MKKRDKISIAIGLIGLASLVGGVSLIFVPAGCMVAGLALIFWSYLLAKVPSE